MSTRAMSHYYANLGGHGGFGGGGGDRPGLLDLIMGTNRVEGGPTIDAHGNVVPGLYQGKGGWAGRRARELNAPLNETALQNRYLKDIAEMEQKHQKELEDLKAKYAKETEGRKSVERYATSERMPGLTATGESVLTPEMLSAISDILTQNIKTEGRMRAGALSAPGSQAAMTEGYQAGLREPIYRNAKLSEMIVPEGGFGIREPISAQPLTIQGGTRDIVNFPTKTITDPRTGKIISQEQGAGMRVTPGRINIPRPTFPMNQNVAAEAAAGVNTNNPPATTNVWDQDYLGGTQVDNTVLPLNPVAPFGMPSNMSLSPFGGVVPPINPNFAPIPADNIPQNGGNIAPTNMPMNNIQRLIEAQKDPRYAEPAWMQRLKYRWNQGNLLGPIQYPTGY